MQVLVIGAAGMIGRKLVDRLVAEGLGGEAVSTLVLADVVAPARPVGFSGELRTLTTDLAAPGAARAMLESRPDTIFHLAAVVSGEAEADFDKGYRSNLDGTRALLEAVRGTWSTAPR